MPGSGWNALGDPFRDPMSCAPARRAAAVRGHNHPRREDSHSPRLHPRRRCGGLCQCGIRGRVDCSAALPMPRDRVTTDRRCGATFEDREDVGRFNLHVSGRTSPTTFERRLSFRHGPAQPVFAPMCSSSALTASTVDNGSRGDPGMLRGSRSEECTGSGNGLARSS